MTFQEFSYQRPDLTTLSSDFKTELQRLQDATDLATQIAAIHAITALRKAFGSMATIGQIRHSINTKDEYYEAENDFYDQESPNFEALVNDFYRSLLASSFRSELEKTFGKQLFTIAELSLKTFQPSILPLLQEENKLSSEYTKLKASAQIELDGKTYNLSSIIPLESDMDRNVRKAAAEAKWAFFNENATQIESIYEKLTHTRTKIAEELGYPTFTNLGYTRMLRSDYTPEMVANYRQQVQQHIVPLATKLYERQRQRLDIETLFYYDEDFKYPSGNAKPQGTSAEIVAAAETMYRELSPNTDAFFQFMLQKNLMDLEAKDGKATGGYCTYIPTEKSPFIFSNFNGTSGDIDVLTHEAGHAFQVFSSRHFEIGEYNFPTYEACEIHSMSMEFFTWRWMSLFFGEAAEKYRFAHLVGAIQFLPYGVAVDEFQHFVYANPNASTEERNTAWRTIEKKYLPHRNYDGNEFLEKGGFWQKQSHIFNSPFYYIDYTLAQVCAFQFWKKDRENHTEAWADYARLCEAGGSQSFLELVKLANLRSPFEDGCMASVVGELERWLESVDDTKF